MNSHEMFTEIDKATGGELRTYMRQKGPLPVCNENDLLVATFCRCMDAEELIGALARIEKMFWAARKAAEFQRACEGDNPTGCTPFNILD